MMNMNGMWGSAFLIGFLTAAWSRIKALLSRTWSVFVVKATMNGNLAVAVKAHCWSNFRRSPFGNRLYSADRVWVRPEHKILSVAYECLSSDPIVFWDGWKPIFLGVDTGGGNSNNDPASKSGMNVNVISLSFIRGTFDLDKLLVTALDGYNEKISVGENNTSRKRFFIRRLIGMGSVRARRSGNDGGVKEANNFGSMPAISVDSIETGELRLLRWEKHEIGPELSASKKALDALAFPPNVHKIITEVDHWLKSQSWYYDKLIPWTRGGNLYGPPGVGKTSLVRAIAQDFDLPVFVFDLGSMSNDEFVRYWQEMQSHAPCIALMEDIDGVFHGRQNILGESGGGLTFDCLLNMLGGIENASGIFKVLTTNEPGNLDDALGKARPSTGNEEDDEMISTRPGRMDWALELTFLDKKCRHQLAERILSDCPQHVTRIVAIGDGDTGAQFQERCAKIALREHWKKKELAELATLGFQPEHSVPACPAGSASCSSVSRDRLLDVEDSPQRVVPVACHSAPTAKAAA